MAFLRPSALSQAQRKLKLGFKQALRDFAYTHLTDPLDTWDLETHWARFFYYPEEYLYLRIVGFDAQSNSIKDKKGRPNAAPKAFN